LQPSDVRSRLPCKWSAYSLARGQGMQILVADGIVLSRFKRNLELWRQWRDRETERRKCKGRSSERRHILGRTDNSSLLFKFPNSAR
jgi:hypothetical protein